MAMSQVPIKTLLGLSRRSYAVAAAEVQRVPLPPAAAATRGEVERGRAAAKEEGVVFWMRDPKTGNWAPENRFAEVDAAELRARLLPKKP